MSEETVSAAVRREVAERAGHCCEYCRSQARFAMQAFSVEHIEPRIQGGASTVDNLALSCQGCNNHKFTRTTGTDPVTGLPTPLFHPRRHRWRDHFAWNEDCTRIIGVTPIGRATVETLQLNREGLVNLRRVLFQVGEHPPPERDLPAGPEPPGATPAPGAQG
jgi:hypothetical protein